MTIEEIEGGGCGVKVVVREDERGAVEHDDGPEQRDLWQIRGHHHGAASESTSVIVRPLSLEVEHVPHLYMAPTHDVEWRRTPHRLDLMLGDLRVASDRILSQGQREDVEPRFWKSEIFCVYQYQSLDQ
uniref:Uncharacterized protein n=1 Tax=Oryza punctata TaxID=4537 RepID=A0A0E0L9K4_ORYPU